MIAIIPARGGSKGLPGKNIRNLNGIPLIAYTISAALKAEHIERVIVTTDDLEIAQVALQYGAEIPFMRPKELASDSAQAIDVYLNVIDFLIKNGEKAMKNFMVLLPTVPLRNYEHIENAIKLFNKEGATTLISVKEAETPVTWYFSKDGRNRIKNAGFGEGDAVSNRQANSSYYVPNGAIYILNYDLLKRERTYYCDNTVAFQMNIEDSIDIDTLLDFEFAEFLIRKKP